MRRAATALAAGLLLPALGWGQAVIGPGRSYTQDFNTLALSGIANAITTLPTGWTFIETGTGANTTYAANTGISPTGNTYSYGSAGSTERALGVLGGFSGFASTIGAMFVNNTGGTISNIRLDYALEQWRASGLTNEGLLLEISSDATSLNTGTWSAIRRDGVLIGASGAVNGNLAKTSVRTGAAFLAIPDGGTVWLRWRSDAPMEGNGLAVDDFTLTATLVSPEVDVQQGTSSLASGTGSYAFARTAPNATTDATFTVGTSVPGSILELNGSPRVRLSGPDASEFAITTQPSATVSGNSATPSTSFVVRFQPTSAGVKSATLTIANNDPDEGTYTVALTGQAGSPLPVELAAFTAEAVGPAAVRLAWATASEKNSQAFDVERSADGREFARIGAVAAAGNSSAPRSYTLLDGQLPAGAATLYYRLRQVDADGTFSYSPVRNVTLAAPGLTIYPNPASHTATLNGTRAGALVQVYDVLGSLVLTAHANEAGKALLELPASLPDGLYLVRSEAALAVRLVVK